MKKVTLSLIFSAILFLGYGQEKPDIDSVLVQFRKTNNQMTAILREYNPVYQELLSSKGGLISREIEKQEMESRIKREFNSLEYFHSIVEFSQVVKFMYSSLNPDYNISSLLFKLEPFLSASYNRESNAAKLQSCSRKYLENLEQLSEVIYQYENVPYFCFQAYPLFSNEKINENLEILNSRIDVEQNGIGYRTQQFLALQEIDLSNSNFSMDLLFKDHKNLRKLDLSNTKIHSIKYIADLNIEWLNLSSTQIDRRDLIYLRYMPSINYLDLSNTNLSRMSITELRNYLMLEKENCIFSKKGENTENESLVTDNSDISY